MTYLKTSLPLTRELGTRELEKFRQLSTVYGIHGLSIEDRHLVILYDATRIHEAEAVALARQFGLPVAPPAPIPSGAFDYTGEFKDYAWPTEGLSPVNAKQK